VQAAIETACGAEGGLRAAGTFRNFFRPSTGRRPRASFSCLAVSCLNFFSPACPKPASFNPVSSYPASCGAALAALRSHALLASSSVLAAEVSSRNAEILRLAQTWGSVAVSRAFLFALWRKELTWLGVIILFAVFVVLQLARRDISRDRSWTASRENINAVS
jgi:hypothetical protein